MTVITTENDGIDEDAGDEGGGLAPGMQDFLDAALARVKGEGEGKGGWDDLDPQKLGASLEKQRREQSQAARKEAALFRDVFMTPDGKKLLRYFIDRFLLRAAFPLEGMTSIEMIAINGVWREAENSFVQAILDAIAVAENQTPKRRSDP